MNKKADLTIIIPCYNVEKYLDDFEVLLKNQTLKGFEVIFIDDCSKDNTKEKLQKIITKNKKYSLISNIKNEGAGYSRNLAIKQAKTEYIGFLDADDVFPEDYLEKLYNQIVKEKSDLVVCDIQVRYDESFGYRPEEYNKIFSNNKVSKTRMIDNTLAASPANKIIKKSIIENNLFAEGIINEDIPAIIGAILDSKKISYVPNTYYTYIQHGGSVQNSSLSPKKLDVFKALDILFERKKNNELLKKLEDVLVFHQILLFFFFAICCEPKFKIRKEYMKKFFEKANKYNLRQNKYYWRFLHNNPKILRLYYKAILKTTCEQMYGLSSLIVSAHDLYKKIRKKRRVGVVKNNITLKEIQKIAKQNQKLKNEYGTISVIIPNYNYANFLYRRLYSILYQKIKINEIIILDDCSKDNSVDMINELYSALKPLIKVKKIINLKNSGCVYKQWQKGFENATSDFVWIAEADDYSDERFLEVVMKPFKKDKNVRLSYTDTSFMLVNGLPTLRSMNILIDLMKTKHWEKDYINEGINEIENYCFLNCTIANASSVIFKKDNYNKEFEESTKYKQVGDWLFYVNVMKKGKIAYTHESLNYCCIHDGSSTATMKKINHFNEIKSLHERFKKEYTIDPKKYKYFQKRYNQLRKEWDLK